MAARRRAAAVADGSGLLPGEQVDFQAARRERSQRRGPPPAPEPVVPMQAATVTMIEAATLRLARYNPRKVAGPKLEALKQSLRVHGVVEPLVVRREGLEVVGGHQRLRALQEIAAERGEVLDRVPCVVLDLDDRRAKLLNIALNNTNGDWDEVLLPALLRDLASDRALAFDEVLVSGFSASEIERYLRDPEPGPAPDAGGDPFASSVTLSLKFDSVAERDAVKALLAERSAVEQRSSGSIVRELLGVRV